MNQRDHKFTWKNITFKQSTEKSVLNHVSGEVHSGTLLAIMGGNNAGKTTLVR